MARLSMPASFTIRNRLLLYFVCLVVLTAVAISATTVMIERRESHDRVVAQLKSVATLKEQQIASWTSGLRLNLDIVLLETGSRRDLHTLTLEVGERAGDAAIRPRAAAVHLVADRAGLFEELFFLGPTGEVLVSTDPGHEGQQLGVNDYFIEGVRSAFIQEPSYALSLRKMTLVASGPVYDRGLTVGVLAGRADLESLNAVMVGRAGLGQTGETYLVGSNHRLLTELRQPGHAIPNTYIRPTGADAAVDRAVNGSATYRGYDGETVVGVYRWIPGCRWRCSRSRTRAEALQATRLALWTTGQHRAARDRAGDRHRHAAHPHDRAPALGARRDGGAHRRRRAGADGPGRPRRRDRQAGAVVQPHDRQSATSSRRATRGSGWRATCTTP